MAVRVGRKTVKSILLGVFRVGRPKRFKICVGLRTRRRILLSPQHLFGREHAHELRRVRRQGADCP